MAEGGAINSALDSDVFKSDTFRKAMWAANMTKIGHLKDKKIWISPENVASKLRIKSVTKHVYSDFRVSASGL